MSWANSKWVNWLLPSVRMFLPGRALMARIASTTLSRMMVVLRQIGAVSVVETT